MKWERLRKSKDWFEKFLNKKISIKTISLVILLIIAISIVLSIFVGSFGYTFKFKRNFVEFNDEHEWLWSFILSLLSITLVINNSFALFTQIGQQKKEEENRYKPFLMLEKDKNEYEAIFHKNGVLEMEAVPKLKIKNLRENAISVYVKYDRVENEKWLEKCTHKKNEAKIDCNVIKYKSNIKDDSMLIIKLKKERQPLVSDSFIEKDHDMMVPFPLEYISYCMYRLFLQGTKEYQLMQYHWKHTDEFSFFIEVDYKSISEKEYHTRFFFHFVVIEIPELKSDYVKIIFKIDPTIKGGK